MVHPIITTHKIRSIVTQTFFMDRVDPDIFCNTLFYLDYDV
jgi:hypothetical protein